MLKHVWGGRGATAINDAKALPQAIMHVGQLVDFRWKLCMSVESNSSKKLGRAFVAVEVTVAGPLSQTTASNVPALGQPPTGRLCLDPPAPARPRDFPCATSHTVWLICCCCGVVVSLAL